MVDPILPAGAAVAAFVMASISWYKMLRDAVQQVHDDYQAAKTISTDIQRMESDAKAVTDNYELWKKDWWILPDKTPDALLQRFWGEQGLGQIRNRMGIWQEDVHHLNEQLKPYMKPRKPWKTKVKFFATKKKYVISLLDHFSSHLVFLQTRSKALWDEQLPVLKRELFSFNRHCRVNTFHILISYLLENTVSKTEREATGLGAFWTDNSLRREFTVLLDLDIFGIANSDSTKRDAEQVGDLFKSTQLKLDLFFREANTPDVEFARVMFERLTEAGEAAILERMLDACRSIINDHNRTASFRRERHTFRLSRQTRDWDPIPLLQYTLRDIHRPTFPRQAQRIEVNDFAVNLHPLGEFSTYRAAFEMAQASLLFLRSTWFPEICRCRIRFEAPAGEGLERVYQFGVEMTWPPHTGNPVPIPEDGLVTIEDAFAQSWCTANFGWDRFTRLLRRLGLLLTELSIGTIITPAVAPGDENNRTAPISHLRALDIRPNTDANNPQHTWKTLSLTDIERLVRRSFHESNAVANAVRHCLTAPCPEAPNDAEWRIQINHFYFIVVQPLRDVYDSVSPLGMS